MEISRIQEEILLILHHSDRPQYEAEIVARINCDRPSGWRQISQASISSTLGRMVKKDLIEVDFIDKQNYNKKYYKISDEGFWSLMQAKDNRKRLSENETVKL